MNILYISAQPGIKFVNAMNGHFGVTIVPVIHAATQRIKA